MNYETTKVRMPSVLINTKDIYYKNLCPKLFCSFIFRQNKNLEQEGIAHFYIINYDLFHYLKIILRFIQSRKSRII